MILRRVHCLWHHRLIHIPWTEGAQEENGARQVQMMNIDFMWALAIFKFCGMKGGMKRSHVHC
jgi:hypothetical protein